MSLGVKAVLGNLLVDVQALHEKVPQSLWVSSGRETTSHTDNSDLVVLDATGLVVLLGDPRGVVLDDNVLLATSLECRLETLGDIGDTNSVESAGGVLQGSHLGDRLLEEAVPSDGL